MPYTGEDWRGPKWNGTKGRILTELYEIIDEHIEELVNEALGNYMDSEEFVADARKYCAEVLDMHKG